MYTMQNNILAHFVTGTLAIQSGFPLAQKQIAIPSDVESTFSREFHDK